MQWPSLPGPAGPVVEDGYSSSQVTVPRRSTCQRVPPECYTPLMDMSPLGRSVVTLSSDTKNSIRCLFGYCV